MGDHLYRLQYRLIAHPEGITKEQAKTDCDEKELGACDKAIIFSIIEPEGGGSSTMILSRDGKTDKELDDYELFKAWSLMAHRLAQSSELDEGRRQLCHEVFEIIRQAVLGATAATVGNPDAEA